MSTQQNFIEGEIEKLSNSFGSTMLPDGTDCEEYIKVNDAKEVKDFLRAILERAIEFGRKERIAGLARERESA